MIVGLTETRREGKRSTWAGDNISSVVADVCIHASKQPETRTCRLRRATHGQMCVRKMYRHVTIEGIQAANGRAQRERAGSPSLWAYELFERRSSVVSRMIDDAMTSRRVSHVSSANAVPVKRRRKL